ncbi:MAG: hypothetical protein JNK60_21135, partial [Acidobacteria bacterium]|nr:hypothetical protein [Acidobacteriota bacterium]
MSAKPLPPRGPRPTLAVAAPFQKHLAKSTLLMAERLLAQGGTVVREVFLRSAIGGEVLAQNGRRFQPLLAVAEGGRLVRASCSCAARLLSPELCPHVAALAHHFAKTGDASIPLPQRFDASLGAHLCEEAVSLGEPLLSREDSRYETRLTARSAAGALLVSARIPRDEKERLLEIFPGGEGPPIERALRDVVATPEEIAFRKAGSASRRERFETSFWGRLANRLFLLFGDGAQTA